MELCPCGSSRVYQACCEMIHRDPTLAKKPETMMRARYSAFVFKKPDFLWKTWHPKFRQAVDSNFEDTFSSVSWIELKVFEANTQQDRAEVRFQAVFREGREVMVLREKSRFSKISWWLYEDGDVEVLPIFKVKQKPNDPCLCGSGKKVKRCCARK